MIDHAKWKRHSHGGYQNRAMCPRCRWTVEAHPTLGVMGVRDMTECPHCATPYENFPAWARYRWPVYAMRRVYFRHITYAWWKPWTWGLLWRWERYEGPEIGNVLLDNDKP